MYFFTQYESGPPNPPLLLDGDRRFQFLLDSDELCHSALGSEVNDGALAQTLHLVNQLK